MKMILSITILGILVTMLPVHAGDNMKAFPPPDSGMVRNDNLKLTHCDNPILTPPKVQLKDTWQLYGIPFKKGLEHVFDM